MLHKTSFHEVEIAPGFWARFRGAKETMECIQEGYYVPIECYACREQICCILDADFVICPACRVVGPVGLVPPEQGGVGLGVTTEDLVNWQHDDYL